jgi:hypothetical protein
MFLLLSVPVSCPYIIYTRTRTHARGEKLRIAGNKKIHKLLIANILVY